MNTSAAQKIIETELERIELRARIVKDWNTPLKSELTRSQRDVPALVKAVRCLLKSVELINEANGVPAKLDYQPLASILTDKAVDFSSNSELVLIASKQSTFLFIAYGDRLIT